MKKLTNKSIANYILLLLFCLASCTKMGTQKPINAVGGKPGVVTNVSVANFKGGATISYAQPATAAGIATPIYIMAEYEINKITHKKRQAKASVYDNKIVVDGFNTAAEYTVTLYSVSSTEEKSDPVVVKVNPLIPPFREVLTTLQLVRDFGGTSTGFINAGKANLAIAIITKNSNKEFYSAQTLYTSADSGRVVARGFDTTARLFGVYVRDKFDNHSDTLWSTFKPIFEQQLDKNKFREYKLPGDNPILSTYVLSRIWDNNFTTFYHSTEGVPMPIQVTFDLGVVTKLSRFTIWQRQDLLYQWGNPRLWTMWGSVNPDPQGSYTGWVKLMDCESIKPSKSPLGTNTADDIAYSKAGEEFVFPITAPAVRYIRFQCQQNWSNSGRLHFAEIAFWGGN